ncbi:isoprenylcysteine carboxylmethyltransferase family protein [uncultured Herbaspirillum sp.]|uniref:isoprenylcysteine carboxylmethyltransferase family protein n=1 Tax=uncultured Herbaspirillum sp. TaxID=160236 RepID=UPI00261E4D45|nr:isoprenylcysteine carboxylmethyltransferase family protein [uncultured Herbaspirillum sp.]
MERELATVSVLSKFRKFEMVIFLALFCVISVFFRLGSLLVSRRHEAALRESGAVEIGRTNSVVLALAHVLYYVSSMIEAAFRPHDVDRSFWLGIFLYFVGMMTLVFVIHLLGRLWTVKLLIVRDHVLVTHQLFRWFRHPNYFLNILPELAGIALILNAHTTLVAGLALYAIPLTIRIRQEEIAMRARFKDY